MHARERVRRQDKSPPLEADEALSAYSNPNVLRFRDRIKSLSYTPQGRLLSNPSVIPSTSPVGIVRAVSARMAHQPRASPFTGTRSSVRKRGSSDDSTYIDRDPSSSTPKKRRTTTKERSAGDPYHVDNNLVDSLQEGLVLVFIGLNPGLTTAATGHAYSHASNLFWKLLHWSEVTPIRHQPCDTHALMDLYSIGNTNICPRPTRSGDGLSKEELADGAVALEEKIRSFKPGAVCIVGKGIWDTIYKIKTGKTLKRGDFSYGWQSEELNVGRVTDDEGNVTWAGSKTFVATTTSGLAAGMSIQEKTDVWRPLGQWLQARRGTLRDENLPEKSLKTEANEVKLKIEDIDS